MNYDAITMQLTMHLPPIIPAPARSCRMLHPSSNPGSIAYCAPALRRRPPRPHPAPMRPPRQACTARPMGSGAGGERGMTPATRPPPPGGGGVWWGGGGGWGVWKDAGEGARSRVVVCVHGLARQGRDFDSLARALSPHARVICPDVAGRGQSDWLADPMAYQIPQYASDMLALLAQLQQSGPISTLDWVGTSMGGLIGLVIAGQPGLPLPVPVRRLVLNDVGPVIQWQALQRIAQYLGRWGQFDSLQQAADALWSVSSSFGPHTPAQWLELSRALGRPLPPGGVGGPCRKAGWHCTTTRRLPCHSGPRTPRQSLSLRARPPCGACTIRSRPARCCCAACSPTCSRPRRRRRGPGADPGRMSASSKAWGMPPC